MDIIKHLIQIHEKCREYIETKNFDEFANYLTSFIYDDVNINELKTILIITNGYKGTPAIENLLNRIQELFDAKYAKLTSEK